MSEIKKTSVLHSPLTKHKENTLASNIIFFLLCLIPVYTAVAFGAVETASLGLLSITTGLIAMLWLYDAWKRGEFTFSTNSLQFAVLGLILIGLIQLLPLRSPSGVSPELLSATPTSSLSLAPYETRFAVILLIVNFVFFAAFLTFVSSWKRAKKVVFFLIIFGSLMAFYGILQELASPTAIYGYRDIGQTSPFGSFFNGHHFAAFMEMTIALPIALLFGKATQKDKRYLLIIAALLMGIAIVFTSSRGGFLSLLAIVGFVIAVNILGKSKDRQKEESFYKKFSLIGGGLALLIVLLGLVLLLGGDTALVRTLSMQTGTEDITNGRLHFWSIAWQNFLNYPILGTGLDSYGFIYPQYDTWSGIFRVERAHNDYLQVLSDAGILGFACVVSFIYFLFRQGLREIATAENSFRQSVAVGALAGCFGILIHSFFDFPLRTPSNSFYFLMLAALATVSFSGQKKRKVRK